MSRISSFSHIVLTGGSSGIGKAFLERALAVDVPLRIANLSRSDPHFTNDFHECQHFPVDLSDPSRVLQVFYKLEAWLESSTTEGRPRILLVNNSGFGCYGDFPAPSLEANLNMIDLNLRAVVQLTGLLLPAIRAGGGGVVNVASTASFQPLAHMSVYAATKAFLLNWGLALHQELKADDAFCLTVCPGPTSTAFFKRAGFEEAPVSKGMGQTAEQVADAMIRGVERRGSLKTSGLGNWLLAGIAGTLPRRWVAPLAARLIKSLRLDALQSKP